MSRDPAYAGAVAFKRAGDPNVGEFSDAIVLKKFGDVPNDLSELRFWDMACSFVFGALARFVAGGAGARPDHPISGHRVDTRQAVYNVPIQSWGP
jgi:hypothetical protein